jgi:hypothetical protein
MDYKNKYLRRNEYFGLIWMAAHRPQKLNKAQVLHLDLDKKCKDLTEMVITSSDNGQNRIMKPKFSLLVSSHLMKGLATILLKKNKYLYDELVNLKTQISRVYIMSEPKKRTKRPIKVDNIDKSAITLKENFPDMMDISSIESMIFAMDKTTAALRYRNVTMIDTDDIIDRSELIPIEHDYTMDSFGGANFLNVTDFAMPVIDDYTIAKSEAAEERELQSMLEDGLPTMPTVTSTVRKPDQLTNRIPFTDMSNVVPEKMRDENTLIGAQNIHTALAFDDFSVRDDQLLNNEPAMIPNLFEPTVIENQEILPIVSERIYEIDAQIGELSLVPVRGMVKSISTDINALKEEKIKKILGLEQAVINRKRKILIIDNVTTLHVSDIEKQRRSSKAYRPGSKEYIDQLAHRRKLFLENNSYLQTRPDYFGIDLLKEPSGLLSRRTKTSLNSYQKSLSVTVEFIKNSKCLTRVRENDDTNFYLSQVNIQENDEVQRPSLINEFSIAEGVRKGESGISKLPKRVSIEDVSNLRSSKRQSSITEQKNTIPPFLQYPQLNPILSEEQSEIPPLPPMNMEQPFETLPIMEPQDMHITNKDKTGGEFNDPPVLIEMTKFEEIILESVAESGEVILQDLIQSSVIPEKCHNMQKPRKFFACKMMNAALNLAKARSIKINQNSPYDSIVMEDC